LASYLQYFAWSADSKLGRDGVPKLVIVDCNGEYLREWLQERQNLVFAGIGSVIHVTVEIPRDPRRLLESLAHSK